MRNTFDLRKYLAENKFTTVPEKGVEGANDCPACGARNSMRGEKKPIRIDDKLGSYRDLTFDFCEECGHVINVELE